MSDRSRSGLAENLGQLVFLISCAVNKNRLFLPFLFSGWIPPQVLPTGRGGRAAELQANIATPWPHFDQTAEVEH